MDTLNAHVSPKLIVSVQYLVEKDLDFSASTDLEASVKGADYVIVSTPTDYNEKQTFLIRLL